MTDACGRIRVGVIATRVMVTFPSPFLRSAPTVVTV